ncbi:MAG TPA: hypothetical protein VLB29_13530 [Nocardioidaceae bacterium]|nr:hypothetical protein [Nocardioidaceae bacterium]
MPTWIIIAFWVVVAVVAVGAYLERRRGHRYQPMEPGSPDQGEFETRAHGRGLQGHSGGGF